MPSAVELATYQRNTLAFIMVRPTVLSLIPRVRVKSGSGTRWVPQTPRTPQTFRIIDQSSTAGPVPGTLPAADGVQRKVVFQLLGVYTAQVGIYDYWVDTQGTWWEVAELLPDNGYERRAQVVRYNES